MVTHRRNSSCPDDNGSNITREISSSTRSVGKSGANNLAKKAQYAEENLRAYAMLELVGDALLSTDIKSNITYMNQAAEILTGFRSEDALGRPLQEIFKVIDVVSRQPRRNLALKVMDTGRAIALHNSALLVAADGSERAIEDSATPLFNESAKVIGALILFHDSRYSSETTAKMSYMAQHDALTGLLNRYAFSEQFEQAAALARRHRKKMVMLFIDLDNFKQVNDSLGHNNGDAILKTLGRKLLACVRETDQVCRYGGDEFVILLSDIEYPEQAFAVVDKVRDSAAALLDLNGEGVSLQLSIGVSIYPDNGETLETLLPHADAAMYRVKATKKRPQEKPKKKLQTRHPFSN